MKELSGDVASWQRLAAGPQKRLKEAADRAKRRKDAVPEMW
jgi:hypothetical protein